MVLIMCVKTMEEKERTGEIGESVEERIRGRGRREWGRENGVMGGMGINRGWVCLNSGVEREDGGGVQER